MKKKALAVMLSMAVVLTGLTGCQGNSAAQGSSSAQGNAEPAGDAAAAGTEQAGGESSEAVKEAYDGELTEIIWQWPSMGSTNSGFQAVEDALNAMMEPDIGVHVTLEPVSFSNMANETVLTVSSGEQLDLCLSVGTGVGNLVSNGLIETLDDVIDEHGAAILKKCGSAMSGGYYNGELYGMPNAYIQGESYGYVARQDLLDKYGVTVDENKFYTLDEIEKIFADVKAGEGDNFFCEIPEATSEEPLSRNALE